MATLPQVAGKKHYDYDSKQGHDMLNSDNFVLRTLEKPASHDPHLKQLMEDGYIILKNAITPEQIAEIKQALSPYLNTTGRNNFEGTQTCRVYGLLAKSRAFDQLLLHPSITSLLDAALLPNHLLTAFQAIQILPGETPQPLHHDDQFVNIPRPRPPVSIATIWAIDEFTKDNGATLIIPGSHKWGERHPTPSDPLVPVVMPAGSVVIFLSTLWHCGGRNVSDKPRMAISSQHCEPWVRPQENQMLVVDVETTRTLHPRIQAMMGYSIHFPFIGHADGHHPRDELNRRAQELASLRAKL